MEEDNRLKALRSLASSQPQIEEEAPETQEEFFERLRAKKDKRRENIIEGQNDGSDLNDQLETYDNVHDAVEQGLTMEQKERIAADLLAKKRREAGIVDPHSEEEVKESIKDITKMKL